MSGASREHRHFVQIARARARRYRDEAGSGGHSSAFHTARAATTVPGYGLPGRFRWRGAVGRASLTSFAIAAEVRMTCTPGTDPFRSAGNRPKPEP